MNGRSRTILGLLLLAASVLLLALWVRSIRSTDVLALFVAHDRLQAVVSHRGQVGILFSTVSFGPEQAWMATAGSSSSAEFDPLYDAVVLGSDSRRWAGFGIAMSGRGLMGRGEDGFIALGAPHWGVALIFAAVGGLVLRRPVRAWRRRRRGLCERCGYDLRGTPGRCPECGLEPAATPPHLLAQVTQG